jgi:pimeloyl-ACP methyl ester carboxylesterase
MGMTPVAPTPGGDAVQTAASDASNTGPAGAGVGATATYGSSERSPWHDVDWSRHQRWVNVGGQLVNTIDLGEGPALVFVHGLSGSWSNWIEQLVAFAQGPIAQTKGRPPVMGHGGHRVIAMDLPGFGYSPMAREEITISGYARLLDGLLEELRIGAAVFVGNSMGGFISTELAIAYPERVERLVLISPAGLSSYRDPRGSRVLSGLRVLGSPIETTLGFVAGHADFMTSRPLLREICLRDLVFDPVGIPASLAAELVRGAGKPGFIGALRAIIAYDSRARLPEIACPTLIVWGDRDRIITARDASVYAELIPNSRKVIYKDTGHLAMVERPAEVNVLLQDFFDK